MPISDEPNKILYYTDGTIREFSFNFKFFNTSDIKVSFWTEGEEVYLEENEDYEIEYTDKEGGSVVLLGNRGANGYPATPSPGTLLIARVMPLDQQANIRPVSGFPEEVITSTFDKLVMIDQQQEEKIQRCLKMPSNSSVSDLILPEPEEGKTLVWGQESLNNSKVSINEIESFVDTAVASATTASQKATEASNSALLSKEYSEEAKFGLKWQSFTSDNWIEDNDKYEIIFPNVGMIVGTYKGTIDNKQKIQNIDVVSLTDGVKIVSIEPFDGFILHSASIIGDYNHEQTLEADEWIINHNLGKKPIVTLVDENDIVMVGTIQYMSLNQIKVNFSAPVKGRAYLV